MDANNEAATIKCQACGEVVAGSKFCTACGAPCLSDSVNTKPSDPSSVNPAAQPELSSVTKISSIPVGPDSNTETPEAIEKYREMVRDFWNDGILEDWEEAQLAKSRGRLGVSHATHVKLMAEYSLGPTLTIELHYDEYAVKHYQVSTDCILRIRVRNTSDEVIKSVTAAYHRSGSDSVEERDCAVIKPGGIAVLDYPFQPDKPGHVEVRGLLTIRSHEAERHVCFDGLTFKVADKVEAAQSVHVDIGEINQRVASQSGINISGSAQQESGEVLREGNWVVHDTQPLTPEQAVSWRERYRTGQKKGAKPTLQDTPSSFECPSIWLEKQTHYKRCAMLGVKNGYKTRVEIFPEAYLQFGRVAAEDSNARGQHLQLALLPYDQSQPDNIEKTKAISSYHFLLRYNGQEVELVDMGSSYGTYVDGNRQVAANQPFILPAATHVNLSWNENAASYSLQMHLMTSQRAGISPADRTQVGPNSLAPSSIVGPDSQGRYNYVLIRRLSNYSQLEYLMLFNEAGLGTGNNSLFPFRSSPHPDGSCQLSLVYRDSSLWLRNKGSEPVQVGSDLINQGMERPLSHRDQISFMGETFTFFAIG